MTMTLRIKRFFLWLLPARKVVIEREETVQQDHRAFFDGREGPRNLGGWSDLP